MKEKFSTKPKHIIRQLKKIVSQLPKEEYHTFHDINHPVYQDSKGDLFTEQASEGEEQRVLITQYYEAHEKNLEREIQKLYKQGGLPLVEAWLWVKMNKEKLVEKESIKEEIIQEAV